MKAEVFTTVVGDGYAEAVEQGSETRGISLHGDRLTAWVEEGGRREVLLDVLLDKGDAGLLFETLKRLKSSDGFDELFNFLTNAEICTDGKGRAHICDEGFDYICARAAEVGAWSA
jgi:hypothetical protein